MKNWPFLDADHFIPEVMVTDLHVGDWFVWLSRLYIVSHIEMLPDWKYTITAFRQDEFYRDKDDRYFEIFDWDFDVFLTEGWKP